jgi:heme oxygenase
MRPLAEHPPALAERLKTATAAMHRRVERSSFMLQLLRGEIDRVRYVGLLHNLSALYAALEQALRRHAARPAIGPVVMPELFRGPAIDADLRVLRAEPAAPLPALRPATRRYVERLRTLEAGQPSLLVAHAYVRYLGDLNGGQALRRAVARGLQLCGDAGTTFYDFGDAAHCRRLMQRFRAGLGELDLQGAEQDAIVAEAVSAFKRHGQLFAELAASG